MNYSGKFDANLPVDGGAVDSNGHGHVEAFTAHATHAPAGAITVPDAQLLFNGDFKRSGVDLVLSRGDQHLVLEDYFKGEKRAALSSPDGAHLTGDLVNALTGHVEYSQADGSASAGKVIGHVTKLTGTATAIRNGVSIILNNGDNVEKGDVVQSGSDSTLGITFIDGTVFGLLSNARMVLNEMVYDSNGSSNSSLISLVAGTISFVAGETAKHGDMKIDTPVATMGIRGTAVLVEIDFNIPGQGGLPDAKFQVLVEPDGTTGSYILFDKNTLTPIATVNQAGQQINISQGQVSITNAPLPPEIQKLIIDVFSLKFTDNTNTKSFTKTTDSIIPETLAPIKLADGATATPVVLLVNKAESSGPVKSGGPLGGLDHIPGPPSVATTSDVVTERTGNTGSSEADVAIGKIRWADINAGDVPSATAKLDSFTYQNAKGELVTATLNSTQLADIGAVSVDLLVVQDAGNKNIGSATWTYKVPDHAFDFLAAGEKLTLTYMAEVNNNFLPFEERTFRSFTITIIGTNDVPVITPSLIALPFTANDEVVAGFLSTRDPTTGKSVSSPGGTLTFQDPDLTDTHTVSVKLATPAWSGGAVPPNPLAAFKAALKADIGIDSTGTGNGTIDWHLAPLPDNLADFLPQGEVLTLTYTITITDSQGATATQQITVTLTHNAPPEVAWINTGDGLWRTDANWETGVAPTASDDVVIPDEHVIGGTGHYAVTIDSGHDAAAKSVTLNADDMHGAKLLNQSTLTIGQALTSFNDGVVVNSGTIKVGGLFDLLNSSSLQNSGLITLAQGGDFKDQSKVTNAATGTIDVHGGTLNVMVDVGNAGHVAIDSGAKLNLTGATIDNDAVIGGGPPEPPGGALPVEHVSIVANTGGTITVNAGSGGLGVGTLTLDHGTVNGGTVNNQGIVNLTGSGVLQNGHLGNSGQISASGGGNALHKESVANTGTIDMSGALLVDHVSTIDNTGGGSITVDITGTLVLDGSSISKGTLGNSGEVSAEGTTALHSVAITNSGTLESTGGVLTIDGSATTFSNTGTLQAINKSVLELTSTTVNNSDGVDEGSITVDATSTLDLDGGDSISGGALGNSGTLDATGTNALTNVEITNTGLIGVTGGTLTIDPGSFTNTGTLEVGHGATLVLDGETVTNSVTDQVTKAVSNGTVLINDSSSVLDLQNATIIGGIVTDRGTIDVIASSTIDSSLGLDGGQIKVENNATLTLDHALAIGANTVTLVGASSVLDDSAGLSLAGGTIGGLGNLAADTDLSGYGTVSTPLDSADHVTASGGKLEFMSVVDGTAATSFEIAAAANSVLKFDAAVGTGGGTAPIHPTITFEGADNGAGVLDLTAISLSSFHGVIANFDEGEAIKVQYAASAYLDPAGTSLKVFDTWGNSLGTISLASSYSGDTFNVSNGTITVNDLAVTLDGSQAIEGTPIKVTAVTDDGLSVAASVKYSWQTLDKSGHWNEVGSTSTYTPAEADDGLSLKLVTTYAADRSGAESTPVDLGSVSDIVLAFKTTASINGTAQVGQVLTAVNGLLNDSDAAVTGYQWTSDGVNISGATGSTYNVKAEDKGHLLQVIETATDSDGGPSLTSTSNSTLPVIGGHGAAIAYMTGTSDPWYISPSNQGSPDAAMNQAFGAGNWTKFQGFSTAPLSDNFHFLYIDGGDGASSQFNSFISSHVPDLQNFVNGGGHLLINAARWDQPSLDIGFGVTLSSGFSWTGAAVNPADSLFHGPLGDAGSNWSGSYFSHDIVTGVGFRSLVSGSAGTVLGDEHFGAGYIMVGGITDPYFQSPQPQADLLRANMLYYADHIV